MRKKVFSQVLLFLIGVFSLPSAALAQTKTISGIVLDDKGSVLSGATVTIKGEKISTATNADGFGQYPGSSAQPFQKETAKGKLYLNPPGKVLILR
jgi:hypothetical protein